MPKSKTRLYTLFHLNLAFSSIDESSHADVIQHCYWPILELAQKGIPVGLEVTLYTLECIQRVDPSWIIVLRNLLTSQSCELIASGDSQIIGPLIPAEVNHWNLTLGQSGYQNMLGVTPRLAYINEQAVSAGLLDLYHDAGFEAVIMEWDNPYSHQPEWNKETLSRPHTLTSASGRPVKVIWNSAVAFQQFQRYVHNEMPLDDYLTALKRMVPSDCHAFPLYGSDAEVFDYRPGRFSVEAQKSCNEWDRIRALFQRLQRLSGYALTLPYAALDFWQEEPFLQLGNAAHPVSVKKQAKYNITRWALSGRNDLLLNTLCHARFKQLIEGQCQQADSWRQLCRQWASDLRTHLTQTRYDALIEQLVAVPETPPLLESSAGVPDDFNLSIDEERGTLSVRSQHLSLELNAKRGLSIRSLAFADHQFKPVLGTLTHGHFDHIAYSADFYSNHLVMERYRERDRVTDLIQVDHEAGHHDRAILIRTQIHTPMGPLTKTYRIEGAAIECTFAFEQSVRPEASLRLGYITLLDCTQRPWFSCVNGGPSFESFQVESDIDHGAPVSSIVSATTALGATTGICRFGTGHMGIELSWAPSRCAALPMVASRSIHQQYLNRLWFSLSESDETLKQGGVLLPFTFAIRPVTAP
jgi:hypothetical protein